ncbi:MAG: LysM peptidoglycan-binding domain-containing protein [Arenicellales bacterium WSBS_2016_MAG_OTU3]
MIDRLKDVTKVLLICVAVLTLASGCISLRAGEKTEVMAEESATEGEMVKMEEKAEMTMHDAYTVARDDSLWRISKQPEIYNTAYNWPIIFKENKGQIKDADLIHPGQVLAIPRDSSGNEIAVAVNHAKNRGAWAVGSTEASDTAYLAN